MLRLQRAQLTWSRRLAMLVTINGQHETLNDEMSVADMLAHRKIEPLRVAVEINEDIVRRGEFARTLIRAGDRIEIVTFVGGG